MVSCHERRPTLYVGEIAKTATGILSARGEWVTLSPKEVGNKLKLRPSHSPLGCSWPWAQTDARGLRPYSPVSKGLWSAGDRERFAGVSGLQADHGSAI